MPFDRPDALERQRIDRWLYFARVVKSRTLAARLAVSGKVRINGEKTHQASQLVRPGDVLTLALESRILVCRVLQAGSRRGPASEARLLYEDLTPAMEQGASIPMAERDRGSGRPTKKDRRAIDRILPE